MTFDLTYAWCSIMFPWSWGLLSPCLSPVPLTDIQKMKFYDLTPDDLWHDPCTVFQNVPQVSKFVVVEFEPRTPNRCPENAFRKFDLYMTFDLTPAKCSPGHEICCHWVWAPYPLQISRKWSYKDLTPDNLWPDPCKVFQHVPLIIKFVVTKFEPRTPYRCPGNAFLKFDLCMTFDLTPAKCSPGHEIYCIEFEPHTPYRCPDNAIVRFYPLNDLWPQFCVQGMGTG